MVQNYRGISLLCIISKVLEKCVFSYVFPFFQPQSYHLQDGFVSGRSCVTSLLRSTHAFAKALDERKQVDTVFLDYSMAFDSVLFNCLLKELFDVGVRGKLLSWFRSYLTCRHHRTVIDGCESSLLPISSGVPQGSSLGPLLFIIYINTAGAPNDRFLSNAFKLCFRLSRVVSKLYRLILGCAKKILSVRLF